MKKLGIILLILLLRSPDGVKFCPELLPAGLNMMEEEY